MGVYLYMSTQWWTGGLLGRTQPLADRWLHVVTLGRACSSGDDSIYFLPRKDCHMRRSSPWKVLCVAKDKHLDNEHLVWLRPHLVTAQFRLCQQKLMIHFTSELGCSDHPVRVHPSSHWLKPTLDSCESIKDSGRNDQWILLNIRQINIDESINDCVWCKIMECNLYLCFYLFLVIYAWAANMV